MKEEGGPAQLEVLKTATELGEVSYKFLVKLTCPFGIKCYYNGEGLEGHALGPLLSTQLNGSVNLNEQETTKESGSGICPEEGFLDITTTPLLHTYIVHRGTMNCESRAGGLYSENGCSVDVGLGNGFWELVN